MYRPEGWNNPYTDECSRDNQPNCKDCDWKSCRYGDFEEGADAMYKALWKMAEESPTKTFTLDANVVNVPSIFIQEEGK